MFGHYEMVTKYDMTTDMVTCVVRRYDTHGRVKHEWQASSGDRAEAISFARREVRLYRRAWGLN